MMDIGMAAIGFLDGDDALVSLAVFLFPYHDLQGEKYRILDVKGQAEARRRIADGMKTVRKREN